MLSRSLHVPIRGDNFEDHSAHLRFWIGALQEDYSVFFRACADAEKISMHLMAIILQERAAIKKGRNPQGYCSML